MDSRVRCKQFRNDLIVYSAAAEKANEKGRNYHFCIWPGKCGEKKEFKSTIIPFWIWVNQSQWSPIIPQEKTDFHIC